LEESLLFFPILDYPKTVTFTTPLTDSYGKGSQENSMTLTISRMPEPINLSSFWEIKIRKMMKYDYCKGEISVSLNWLGEEAYSRYRMVPRWWKWWKADQNTTVMESGESDSWV